ncbi:MAG: D-alanine--D-alanine ligase [Thiotrichaceae bacterium]
MTQNFGKVAVLMGGNSAERDISLNSGHAVLQALLAEGVDAVKIDTAHHAVEQLIATKFDCAFIVLHGRGGEDGSIQGVLQHLQIPYTGSGVMACAVAMDKYRTKLIWQGLGFPTPASMMLDSQTNFDQVVQQLGLPLMVKPILEGSSVGISKVTEYHELSKAYLEAAQFNCDVIAEKFITGVEYTVAILHNSVLPLIQLAPARAFYDYVAKYTDCGTQYICPCGLPATKEQDLQSLALQAFRAVGATGWGRVDLMLDTDGQPWLIEVNTVPGMTDHSLVPMAAKAAGINFNQLVLKILETTL